MKSKTPTARRSSKHSGTPAAPKRGGRCDGPLPVIAPLFEAIPAEVIDLTTGPFERNFPELAARRERRGD